MEWQNIKTSEDSTHFHFDGKRVFGRSFLEVLKFHSPGLAPVKDETGAYHIDVHGQPLYQERYNRTFGFYCNKAAIMFGKSWFHINDLGNRAYSNTYTWVGNYQENLCAVRDIENNYFHINLSGNRAYATDYLYAGDFKDGFAAVKTNSGLYRHINTVGEYINGKHFLDLGVFHKNFAIAQDKNGWHHIDKSGKELYNSRYLAIEPFYNGLALVTGYDLKKSLIDESGREILKL